MNNAQESIVKTRTKIHKVNRLVRTMFRQIKEDNRHAETNLELFLDDLAAEGVVMSKDNIPNIMVYVRQFIEDQARKKEAATPDETSDDHFQDFPL
jgi:hypothetical protein